jgi:hypothetical protein
MHSRLLPPRLIHSTDLKSLAHTPLRPALIPLSRDSFSLPLSHFDFLPSATRYISFSFFCTRSSPPSFLRSVPILPSLFPPFYSFLFLFPLSLALFVLALSCIAASFSLSFSFTKSLSLLYRFSLSLLARQRVEKKIPSRRKAMKRRFDYDDGCDGDGLRTFATRSHTARSSSSFHLRPILRRRRRGKFRRRRELTGRKTHSWIEHGIPSVSTGSSEVETRSAR